MILPREITDYLEIVEKRTVPVCKEQIALAAHVRKAFETEALTIDTEKLARFMSLAKYFPFELYPYEKFMTALWDCTYRQDGFPRWPEMLWMIGRGGGKDGFIGYNCFCSVSPYNSAGYYDVDICANNEDQAMRPVRDIVEVLETQGQDLKLKKHYYHTKELVQGRKNRGIIRGRTNSPKGHDGMRSGKIILNEVHAYENYENIEVFTTGLGKKKDPRTGIFTTEGKVFDGPLDDYKNRAERILFEGEPDNGFLPVIFKLDEKDEVHDPANWVKANPSLLYNQALKEEIRKEYNAWREKPEEHGSFILKRMNLREGSSELGVTDYEKVKATNRPIPHDQLIGKPAVVGIDYAELSDWAAVDIHFRIGDERYDINHAWICAQSKTLPRVKAPWQVWAEKGLVTVVQDVSISPELIAGYIQETGQRYAIQKVAFDSYRWNVLAEALTKIGFDGRDKERVKLVRPSDIMQIEPVIQELFDRGRLTWGDNPVLRWAVQNTKRVPASRKIGSDTGNYYYAKIDAKARKTDPFMAFVAAVVVENALGSGEVAAPPPLGAIVF